MVLANSGRAEGITRDDRAGAVPALRKGDGPIRGPTAPPQSVQRLRVGLVGVNRVLCRRGFRLSSVWRTWWHGLGCFRLSGAFGVGWWRGGLYLMF